MDVSTANRLYEYRRKNHLSQEELAEKLGVSRQAVSKWERAEASPDTDNLINLSRLYGVSLDTLLNTDPDISASDAEEEESEDEGDGGGETNESADGNDVNVEDGDNKVHIGKDGVHIEDGNEKVHVGWKGVHIEDGSDTVHVGWDGVKINENGKDVFTSGKYRRKRLLQDCPISLFVIAAYLVMGFAWNLWHPGWIVFFAIPVLHSLFTAIDRRNANKFAWPVFITAVYLLIGCVWGLWHPYWALFLTIPLYYGIVKWIRG